MADLKTAVPALKYAGGFWRGALPKVWGPLIILVACNFMLSPAVGIAPVLLPVIVAVDILALVLAYGALMRLALSDLHSNDPIYRAGPAGMQWNTIETKVLGSVLLLAALAALLTIAAVFLVMLVTIVVAAVTGTPPKAGTAPLAGPSVIALWVALAVSLVLIVWTFIRLSLAMAATVDRRQVQVFSTWGMTRGRVLALLAALVVVTLPTLLLSIAARALQSEARPHAMSTVLWALYALVAGLAQTPLTAGVTVWFYRQAR